MTPLLDMPGMITQPSLSPHGDAVAFSWCQPDSQCGLYTRPLRGGEPTLLVSSNDEGSPGNPRWSPDGKRIVFTRTASKYEHALFVIAATRGEPRRLGAFCEGESAWTSDSRPIIASLYRQDHDGDCDLGLISAGDGKLIHVIAQHGSQPSLSPDGKTLAFVRGAEVNLLPLSSNYRAAGAVTTLVHESSEVSRPLWISGGAEILYLLWDAMPRLRRIAATPGASPRVIDGIEGNVDAIEASRDGRTLLVETAIVDKALDRIDLKSANRRFEKVRQIPWTDDQLSVSPDGARIVFPSSRGGLWTANLDGSGSRQITATRAFRPVLSPDGMTVAFTVMPLASNADSREYLFTVPFTGGSPRRLIPEVERASAISWSRDGKWIYFAMEDAAGKEQIWKVRLADDQRVQVTTRGGFSGQESADEKFFYYLTTPYSKIHRVPVGGGEEELLSDTQVERWAFAVGAQSVYFVPARGSEKRLTRLDMSSGAIQTIASIPFDPKWMQLSADERFLYAHEESKSRWSIRIVDGVLGK